MNTTRELTYAYVFNSYWIFIGIKLILVNIHSNKETKWVEKEEN